MKVVKSIGNFLNPRSLWQIQTPAEFGKVTGSCWDTKEIYLKTRNGKFTNATFWVGACGPSIASGSMTTELMKGKSITEGWENHPG